MASELDAFLIEAVEAAIGPVRRRAMFGGTGLWSDDVFFAMIWDGALSIRLDEEHEPEFLERGFVPNDPDSADRGRKRYYEVPADVLEDSSALAHWLGRSLDLAASDRDR